MKRRNLFLICLLLSFAVTQANAASYDAGYGSAPKKSAYNADARDEPKNMTTEKPDPHPLTYLQELSKSEPVVGTRRSDKNDKLGAENAVKEEKDLALKIRRDAMKEAALSFGARGGLTWRTKEIMDKLKQNEAGLDKTYNFRRLLIKAPSEMYIEPPIVSEALNNFVVTNNGEEAAVADAIYQISRQARIVSAPRNWRQYLERDWKDVSPPPDILLPETAEERAAWRKWVAEGWNEGYKQADEIFQADLNRMIADFEGMVRYRVLLAQNKISAPYATLEDRGVSSKQTESTVGDREVHVTTEMRVGDRAIRITQPATLRTGDQGAQWEPPIRSAP